MNLAYAKAEMKVADQLFLALALLHRERPDADAFTVDEVVRRASEEGFEARPASLRAHAHGHAAANLPPGKNGRYRLLYKQADGRVRMLHKNDAVHPERNRKFYPELNEIPEKYHALVAWARAKGAEVSGVPSGESWLSGLRELRGLGRDAWQGVKADDYVRGLREGWE
jgi:hypothetical protein